MVAATSIDALQNVDTEAQRMEVLRLVKLYSPYEKLAKTAAELAVLSAGNFTQHQISRRLPELKAKKLIKGSDDRSLGRVCKIKKTRCKVWCAE